MLSRQGDSNPELWVALLGFVPPSPAARPFNTCTKVLGLSPDDPPRGVGIKHNWLGQEMGLSCLLLEASQGSLWEN